MSVSSSKPNNPLVVEGFEASRVFTLVGSILDSASSNPGKAIAPGMPSKRNLIRQVNSLYLCIIHPSGPLDPSNPRVKPQPVPSSSRPRGASGGGALRPALWYLDLRKTGAVGRGQPTTAILGRKKKADVVLECNDRDFVDMATGKVPPQKLYQYGRLKLTGNLDRAWMLHRLLSQERGRFYPAASNAAKGSGAVPLANEHGSSDGLNGEGTGAPAPVPDSNVFRARL
ncbi:hypothetical protein OC846_000846 [Tilletia horrida]|uniref:SCP2 domain-containing protein n=1 Tax=Tilletia horrida TaxID=155126 RepID=A0AAN6JWH2_9BASI|nr:hypothetical protein OC845_001199 [Tilletia horrida]KAK0556819.1 hypothetical protein OC846_000846 [Tilletia horrida]KAK0569244.1 hypothetical protein OC861_001170 [Tilletia horrida]